MCTSIVVNTKKTIIGWNLDLLDMEWRVQAEKDKVSIAINDKAEGWMPLFGANNRGDFVAMPTCWPYDNRSDAKAPDDINIIHLDVDLLLKKKTFKETKQIVENKRIVSVNGLTFQSQLSDREGNVLRVIPGQGYEYLIRPQYSVMTNFSPIKGDREKHPWMGLDRYQKANELLKIMDDTFDVADCFHVLKDVSQTVCPTVVSMVFDVGENHVFWCENQDWNHVKEAIMA